MKIVNDDLFNAPQGQYLVNCVSADMADDIGLPKRFDELFKIKKNMKSIYDNIDATPKIGDTFTVGNVINVVVKSTTWDRVNVADLTYAIMKMAEMCRSLEINNISMPYICCGRNGVDKESINALVDYALKDFNVTIYE